MRVRLLVSRATATAAQQPGDEIEVSADEGRRMIAARQAQPVRRRATEKAVPTVPPETAAR